MIFFYLIACIPLLFGAVQWMYSKKIVWWEWIIGSACAFIVSAICHLAVIQGLTADIETWSGQIKSATYQPEWIEEYQESHQRVVGHDEDGNEITETYYTTEHRTHTQHWSCYVSYGATDREYDISQSFYKQVCNSFGNQIDKVTGSRPGFDGGDRYDYKASNHTGYIFPTNTTFSFENRVKAAPSIFSFAKVPKDVKVFSYPTSSNWQQSNRLLGTNAINITEWDQMNSRLGPTKKVNCILIAFGNKDKQAALWQEAAWCGGKKNDLVLCYGDGWSYVFGWTEESLVKLNLSTLLIENAVNKDLIPKIESEIKAHYKIKDWSKFNYLAIDPPMWSFVVLIVVMVLTQTAFWVFAYVNDEEKVGCLTRRYWRDK